MHLIPIKDFWRIHNPWAIFALGVLLIWVPLNLRGQAPEMSLNRKVINEDGFREIVHVTDRTPVPKTKRTYYWYKTRSVHSSQDNYAGELLDGDYIRYYPNNQLAEKGTYTKGLREGLWTTWYPNGNLASKSRWKQGREHGKFLQWDSLGTALEHGKYRRGNKVGEWVDHAHGDTLRYKRGRLVPIDTTGNDSLAKRDSWVKRIFTKKNKENEEVDNRETAEKQGFFHRLFQKKKANGKASPKARQRMIEQQNAKPSKKEPKKPGFFKRLFQGKRKKPKEND